MNLKYFINKSWAFFAVLLLLNACNIDEIPDPNGPTLEPITANATVNELNTLAIGCEALMRFDLDFYYTAVGVVGREYYRFTTADPRYTADLVGSAPLDNNTFYTTRSYAGRYRCVRNANTLLEAVANTKADLTDADKNGYKGFANTIKAYQLLLNLNQQYQNGIRIDVADPNNLGAFVGYDDALSQIGDILSEANGQLTNADEAFKFNLSSGFSGFDTPAEFNKFNRALAARVALYGQEWGAALEALDGSFFDMNESFFTGVFHYYSTAGGDQVNALSFPANTQDGIVAQMSYISDIEANDGRLAKVALRDTFELDGLLSTYDVNTYPTPASFIPIMRNEELILIYAEANAQLGNTNDAVAAIDKIRTTHGLPAYNGGTSKDELINEILKQRRYSLYAEGHRWVDMRRYNKLNELPNDREGDQVWQQFPRPATEN